MVNFTALIMYICCFLLLNCKLADDKQTTTVSSFEHGELICLKDCRKIVTSEFQSCSRENITSGKRKNLSKYIVLIRTYT